MLALSHPAPSIFDGAEQNALAYPGFRLPLALRRWWAETDYGSRPPSPALAEAMKAAVGAVEPPAVCRKPAAHASNGPEL
jgi:hypothetical protein